MGLLLQEENSRYRYVVTAGKVTRTGPHLHDEAFVKFCASKDIEIEESKEECTGCIVVDDSADVEVRVRATDNVKESKTVAARGELTPKAGR